jgi:hypothetical protein
MKEHKQFFSRLCDHRAILNKSPAREISTISCKTMFKIGHICPIPVKVHLTVCDYSCLSLLHAAEQRKFVMTTKAYGISL